MHVKVPRFFSPAVLRITSLLILCVPCSWGIETVVSLETLPAGGYGNMATSTSYDGSVVCGLKWQKEDWFSKVWICSGDDYTFPNEVWWRPRLSSDGSTFLASYVKDDHTAVAIVGDIQSGESTEVFEYGYLMFPGSLSITITAEEGYVIAGTTGFESFQWTVEGLQWLGDFSMENHWSASDISDNGKVIIGTQFRSEPNLFEACRWEDGVLTGLGDLEGGGFYSDAYGVSADGSVIVGRATSSIGDQAFRWADGKMFPLETVAGEKAASKAYAVSADGTIIVGWDNYAGIVLWTEKDNWAQTSLADVLNAHIIEFPDTWFKDDPQSWWGGLDISGDGTTIVGSSHSEEDAVAYRVRIVDMWGPYEIHNGMVKTDQFLGTLCVDLAPWTWCVNSQSWLWLKEDCAEAGCGWVFATDLESLLLYCLDGTNWAWSFSLDRWIWLSGDPAVSDGCWLYVPAS